MTDAKKESQFKDKRYIFLHSKLREFLEDHNHDLEAPAHKHQHVDFRQYGDFTEREKKNENI